jgi:uncharacterized membrane protein YfcA
LPAVFPLSAEQLLLAAAIVAFASAVQASLGFGLAMIAAPLLLFIDRALIPGPVLSCALLLSILVAHRERQAMDLRGVAWAIGGRVLGTLPAVFALRSLSSQGFDVFFALLVMLAVLLSVLHPHLRPTPGWLLAGGTLSGFMGTISSIGGPPIALVYQNWHGPELRATLSGFFVLGCLISISLLSLAGLFGRPELLLSLALAPGVVLGFWASRFAIDRVSSGATRPFILSFAFASAAALLLRIW